MNDIIQEFQAAFFRQRQRLRRYTALLVALALVTTLFVNWQLHSDGIAKTADYQCNLEEHEHTAECYPLVLVCGYEEGQPEDGTAASPEEDSALDESFDVPEPVFVPHVHTDDCYQDVVTEVPVLTCYQEEHLHTDDCFDPEDGTLLCGLFEHTHSEEEGCYAIEYETTRELVCGYEEGELVEEAPSACTDAAAFADAETVLPAADEAPQPAEPVLHHHTEACYAPDYTAAPLCGLEEHHHTVNCLADPLADVEDESDWLAKTNTALSGDWSADLLTVAQSQLGYAQSEKNFELDADDGQTVRHYTRYGQWYGNPYGSWDVMFLSYCLNYADIPQSAIPQRAGTQALRSDLRATGYLMDPQSIPAAQQDAIALCDEEMPDEAGFADAADDLGFADSASTFRSIRPGDIVFYNAAVTETVAAENEPQIETLSLESDADTGDPVPSSLSTPADPPRTEQRTTVSETLGIVSDVDETSDTLSVISGNVDGKVDTVQVDISQLTGLISLAAVQEEESLRAEEAPVVLGTMTPGGSITGITVTVNDETVIGNLELTDGDKLKLNYDYSIPANTITADGDRTLTYQLPEGICLSTAIADRPITQDQKQVGTLNVSKDGHVTLTFNSDFQADQPFTDSFGLEAEVTTSQIGDGGTITFPGTGGTGVTITVHDKTSLDLEKKHLYDAEENGKTYAYYRLTVTSKDDWNETITIHDLLDNSNASNGLSGSYDQNSFVLTDKDGNSIPGYSPTFSGNGFEVKDLPGLKKGEKYILTYRVEITNMSKEAPGYELPSTGGAGTTLYTAVGGTMVLAALVCGFCQKRRRERRAD